MTADRAGRPPIVRLGSGQPPGADDVGGKGAALDRLIRAGFDIPPVAAVTAAAYRHVAADPGVRALIERIEAGEAVAADTMDRAFVDAAVPDGDRRGDRGGRRWGRRRPARPGWSHMAG